MNKLLPIAAIALAAVAVSCSNDDDDNGLKNPSKDAITFSRPFLANSINQRAAATNANFSEFKVWGFVNQPDSYVFNGDKVSLSGGAWTVNRTEYWYLGHNYYFTGVAPIDESVTFTPISSVPADGIYAGGGTISFDNRIAEGDEDLVYAFAGPIRHNETTDISPVALTFNHLLSQVSFQFKNEVSQATVLEIQMLNLKATPASGTIDMNSAEKTWATNGTFDINDIDADATFAFAKNVTSEPVYIIPASAQYEITFNVIVRNGSQIMATYPHTVTLPAVNFEKGNSYRFTATLNSANLNPANPLQPITFTVESVDDWVAQDEPIVGK